MKKLSLILILSLFFIWGGVTLPLRAATISVPADQPNIQAALDAAGQGDTVLVAPGTYKGSRNKNLDFNGKAIHLKSESGPELTIIDCGGNGRGFHFKGGETNDAIVEGFTIMNGNVSDNGGGILCTNASSPTIRNNIIKNNTARQSEAGGGGIYCGANNIIVENNIITGNAAAHASRGFGGGVLCAANALLINNLIDHNSATAGGGGVSCLVDCRLINNTIVDNTNFGVHAQVNTVTIKNTIIWGNVPQSIVRGDAGFDLPNLTFSGIQGGWAGEGNTDDAPLFVNSALRDYRLSENSPYIDAGTAIGAPETGIEGHARGLQPDLGAYEFSSVPVPKITKITPNGGSIDGGTIITITGSSFVDETTVTVGGRPATNVNIGSPTELTAHTPSGGSGLAEVTVTNPDGSKAIEEAGFFYFTGPSPDVPYKVNLNLGKGLNSFSLPVNPELPVTASKLSTDLDATIILRVADGEIQGYIHDEAFGEDFTIEMGKGYILNLRQVQSYSLEGKPWGDPIIPAPQKSPTSDPWAFLIAGRVEEAVPPDGQMRVTNSHTGESQLVPIKKSGEFMAAFVDMNKGRVISAGDEILMQLINANGTPLTDITRHHIVQENIEQAYLMTRLSAISQTRLLQNYPNPFNPETWIPYELAEASAVTIELYNAQGQLVQRLGLGLQSSGRYTSKEKAAYWDGKNASGDKVASGIYFYHLQAGDYSAVKRMVILK